MPHPGSHPEKLRESLTAFTKEHRAKHWQGSFADYLEQVLPGIAHLQTRGSHQYMWDMLRWYEKRQRQPGTVGGGGPRRARGVCRRGLCGIDGALDRVIEYFKAASAGSDVSRRLL